MRLRRCVMAWVLAAACGCSWSKRPYTHDPLLAGGRGVWGAYVDRPAFDEPSAPPAPPVTSP